MNASIIIARSVRFYWRTHLGVVLGAALATMVLTGSLLVGDSVKATLRRQAALRVGKIETVMVGGDRFFRHALADEVGEGNAPVLMLRGSVARADGAARVNQSQVIGVDPRFWQFAPGTPSSAAKGGELLLNERLATQLNVKTGDVLVIRVEKPGLFSRDAPLSGEENEVIAIRLTVGAVLTDEQFGRFGLQASQIPPFTVFLPLETFQERVQMKGRANLLLARAATAEQLRAAVPQHWQLVDADLELRPIEKTGGLELRTGRVFLEPPIVEAAPRGMDVLTYLVNELRSGEKAAPYSMVTAIDAAASGFLPAELADDEIVISQWLADDLGVGLGEKVQLKYFVMGERRQLEARAKDFTVLAILPMDEPHLNRSWMPDFPGLADAENCRDWEPGFAMDLTKIRDQDEAYWDTYRGTPKAFINIAVGQQMWGNRWGNLTAIRYRPGTEESVIAQELRTKLNPEQIGVSFVPLREQALAATRAPVDFGELFVSFSFFLIAAAAVLTGLLFVFSLEQRHAEAGLLLSVGWRPAQVQRLLLWEGAALALIGSLLGAIGALLYTKLVLRALATVWRGAVGATEFVFSPSLLTVLIGVASGVAVAIVSMWLASRRQLRHTARELLAGSLQRAAAPANSGACKRARAVSTEPARWRSALSIGWIVGCVAAAAALAGFGDGAGAFFGAGSLLLVAGFGFASLMLRKVGAAAGTFEDLTQLGVRNAARRLGRSLATIAVLASGVFMVVAVDSFRQRPQAAALERSSGTGGFALVAESSLPIYDDLNTEKGREAYALEPEIMRDVRIVPMRVRDGDDASCLNLNRALQPRLLGVKPEELASRQAFRFAAPSDSGFAAMDWEGWAWLEGSEQQDGAIPAIADAATVKWALQKKLGDTLEYRDERGAIFQVRIRATLASSMLQGQLLISEQNFIRKYPSHGGYRFFLVDAPLEKMEAVGQHLSRALQDRGFEVTPASRRLAEFQAVENAYLSIFQVLGGLGLLLGSAGLAIVVARNVLERRSEFGLLEAVGFRRRQLRRLVFAEHRWLIACGLVIGAGSSLLAVWPGLRERATDFPWAGMGLLLAALGAGCVFWTWLATRIALRGSGIDALRAE